MGVWRQNSEHVWHYYVSAEATLAVAFLFDQGRRNRWRVAVKLECEKLASFLYGRSRSLEEAQAYAVRMYELRAARWAEQALKRQGIERLNNAILAGYGGYYPAVSFITNKGRR